MSNKEPILIKESMDNIIKEHTELSEIREMLLQFVDYQSAKGFPFGELLLLHYNLFNGFKTEEIYSVAAAMEFLVLASDILDDFEDDDTIYKPWSSQRDLALNATTNLLFLNLKIITESNFKNKDKGVTLLIEYVLKSINGQYKDLLNICRSESQYINMSIEKSGSLTALACLLGTILATDDYPEDIEIYSKYMGLIGQINNDIADFGVGNEKSDIMNHKYSLPIIFLLNCKDKEVQFLQDYYHNQIDKNEILKKEELLNKKFIDTGAMAYTEVIKRIYQNKAMTKVQSLHFEQCYMDQLQKFIY